MSTRSAPQTFKPTLAGLSTLLLCGTWCAPAMAASDIQPPCPELVSHTEASLHVNLNDEAATPALRALESGDTPESNSVEADDKAIRKSEMPDIATRLPGVSATDMPRFRRYMFRTDI